MKVNIVLDIPNLTSENIQYGKDSYYYAVDLQVISMFPTACSCLFPRCTCSREDHSRKVKLFKQLGVTLMYYPLT